jgi:two-component system, chemotaxis family, protein-glutamate methylesterase/glutaminase
VANRDIVAIGASAGGFEALLFLAKGFPADFPASVLIVMHLPTQFQSGLDSILTQSGPIPASFARDGERLEGCRIYIGAPGFHLILDGDRLRLGTGQREHNARPAIDPLFRSVALCCAPRAVGVVLTGTLGDGASGLQALKQCGGLTVVQDPHDAAFPEMPATALSRARPDHVVSLAAMPALLHKLVKEPVGPFKPVPENLKYEVEIARTGRGGISSLERVGRRSVLACPDCHGVMWEIDEGNLVRYRCHIGHAYTAEMMSIALDENLTRAMGSALRALDERIALAERMRRQASERGRMRLADVWAQRAAEFEQEANVIRASIKRVDEIAGRLAKQPDPRAQDVQLKDSATDRTLAPSDRQPA